MEGLINFGRLIFECDSEIGVVSWGTGEGASFGSRKSFGDGFLGVPGADLSGLFNRRLLGGRGELGDLIDFSFTSFLASSAIGLLLLSFSAVASSVTRLLLGPAASGDFAKPLLIARGVTTEDGEVRVRALVGVVGGGCGESSFARSIGAGGFSSEF